MENYIYMIEENYGVRICKEEGQEGEDTVDFDEL